MYSKEYGDTVYAQAIERNTELKMGTGYKQISCVGHSGGLTPFTCTEAANF